MKSILSTLFFLFAFNSEGQMRGELWGVTREGGYGNGVIYKIDTAGKQQVVYEFPFKSAGYAISNEFCETGGGVLYGVTNWGGIKNCGTIFRYDPKTGSFVKKADFTGDNGRQPCGRLIQAPNGKLYGVTNKDGQFGGGTLFEYDPVKSTLKSKIHFKDTIGYAVFGTLTLGSDGLIYGNTLQGGRYSGGVIFSYNPNTSAYRVRYHFNYEKGVGTTPRGAMVKVGKKLYGFTGYGSGNCILFEFDIKKNKYSKKLVFPSGVGARYSCDGMILYHGKLYGAADKDFAPNSGFIFEYDPIKNELKILKKLNETDIGGQPVGVLALAQNGKLYGLINNGVGYNGTLFEFDIYTLSLKTKYSFNEKTGGPATCVMRSSNGKLYGATSNGGSHGMGYIFEFDPTSDILKARYALSASDNGEQIAYGLALSNAKLYGIMGMGGASNGGILFEFDPIKKILTKKVDFNKETGRAPIGKLLASSSGKIYGVTCYGGKYDQGTLYEYDPVANSFQIKFHFNNATKNRLAMYGLEEGPKGKLYGITTEGAATREGMLYEFDPANNSFREITMLKENGHGNLTFTSLSHVNRKIVTWLSSHYESATVLMEYDPGTDIVTSNTKISPYGDYCMSKTVIERNGRIYGFCKTSNEQNRATVIFEYDPTTKNLEEKYTLNDDCLTGNLMKGSDGAFYGNFEFGGQGNKGSVFKYDPASNTFTRIADFIGPNGARPCGNLIEIEP